MKALAMTLIFALSAAAGAQACDRNKIDSSVTLSNSKGNFYNVVKNSSSKTTNSISAPAKGRR